MRDKAIEHFGKTYVENIERMALINAERLTYYPEGYEAKRQEGPDPFIVDLMMALDPCGGIGMSGVPVDSDCM